MNLGATSLSYFQMAVPVVLGGMMGVLLAAIFRRYFCEDMHHLYPFPAGRAAAGVLTCGQGNKAKLMIGSGIIAMAYDFILNTLGWWQEVISTTAFQWGQTLADKYKIAFRLDTEMALLGIGYFTGLRYAAIIAAGSFFSWLVCIPIVYYLGAEHMMVVGGKEIMLADAPIGAVFSAYVRHIGIGMLAMSGIIGLLSMSKVVTDVIKTAVSSMVKKQNSVPKTLLRTQRDLSMPVLLGGIFLITFLFIVFFHVYLSESIVQTVVAFCIILVFTCMLSVVAISSIAFTGNEPASGMTIFMLIVAAVILGNFGMYGESGIVAILMMATFLCSALAVAGNFMSELKVAHLLGATPRKMQQWQLVSTAIAGIVSVGVVLLLDRAYGFTGPHALNAPQANAMAAIIQPLMEGGAAHWPLYMAGAFLAVIFWMMKIPPLAFALGTYLPMDINLPILVGGVIAHLVSTKSKDENINAIRLDEGGTIASGLIAGGALGSLISALLRIMGIDWFMADWVEMPGATYLGMIVYFVICILLYKKAMTAKL